MAGKDANMALAAKISTAPTNADDIAQRHLDLKRKFPVHFAFGGNAHGSTLGENSTSRSYNEAAADTFRGYAVSMTASNMRETAEKMERWFSMMAGDGIVPLSLKMSETMRAIVFAQDREAVVAQVMIYSGFSKMGRDYDPAFVSRALADKLGDRSSPWGLPYPTAEPLAALAKAGEVASGMKEGDKVFGKTRQQIVEAAKDVLEMYAKWVENSHEIPNPP